MGKIDDMRRLREEQHEAKQKAADKKASASKAAVGATNEAAAKPKKEEPASPVPAPAKSAPAAKKGSFAKPTAGSDKGECSSCGKQKALQNGVIANHQKGFGKMCPGSRKAPA